MNVSQKINPETQIIEQRKLFQISVSDRINKLKEHVKVTTKRMGTIFFLD